MEINKDDLYEIEKILDIYSGWITDKLNLLCKTATNQEAFKENSDLQENILDLNKSYKQIKEIRLKFENQRKRGSK